MQNTKLKILLVKMGIIIAGQTSLAKVDFVKDEADNVRKGQRKQVFEVLEAHTRKNTTENVESQRTLSIGPQNTCGGTD